MRHIYICTAIDSARDALKQHDFALADRIRNEVYASGAGMNILGGNRIGDMIAEARGKLPFAPVEQIRRRA